MSPSSIKLNKGACIYQNYAPLKEGCPPLVFIHGMWGHGLLFALWLNLCELLDFKAYSIELPKHHAHDRSGLGSQSVTNHYVPAVDEAVNFIGPCVLVGWSMGGVISALVASENSNVKKLVLLASGCFRGTFIGWTTLLKLRNPRYLFAIIFRKEYRIMKKDSRSLMFNHGFSDFEFSAFEPTLMPESGQATLEMIFGPELPGKIACSILVIGGGADMILPPRLQKRTAEKLGAKYLEIPDASHAMMVQRGVLEKALGEILSWVQDNRPQELQNTA